MFLPINPIFKIQLLYHANDFQLATLFIIIYFLLKVNTARGLLLAHGGI